MNTILQGLCQSSEGADQNTTHLSLTDGTQKNKRRLEGTVMRAKIRGSRVFTESLVSIVHAHGWGRNWAAGGGMEIRLSVSTPAELHGHICRAPCSDIAPCPGF